MITATKRLRLDAQVHLKVGEEVNVFARLKWHKDLQTAHGGSNKDQLLPGLRVQLALDNLGAHLTDKELVDRFHLESSSVEVAVFPLELCCSWIVLCIIFTARWQPVDVDVLKFIHACYRVLVKHAKTGGPPLQHIICEDVKLGIVRLVLEHVDRLTEISGKDATSVFNLNTCDDRLEVFVLLLA